MTYKEKLEELKEIIRTDPCYRFLKEAPELGNNIIMLGLGGSYAYGTWNEGSDIDLRGIAYNSPENILLGKDFEQYVETDTDTTIYSIRKILNLLAACNPNTIEILGLRDDQIFFHDDYVWPMIRKNKNAFLSKKCVNTFGGYANAQLRRLSNKAARLEGQTEREKHILDSIRFAEQEFRSRYPSADVRLYIDRSDKEDMESEIFIDGNFDHYPFRDIQSLMNDFHTVVRAYDKIGKRNSRAIEHNKLGKHMMHLVRLYYMCFDILEKGEINTYREQEHDFLMEVRNGKYLDKNRQPVPDFYKLVDRLDERLKKAAAASSLPDDPDYRKTEKILIAANRHILEERR